MSDASRAILGCIMFEGRQAMPMAVEAGIEMAWFEDPQEALLWKVAFEVFAGGNVPDPATCNSKIQDMRWLDNLVHASYGISHMPGYLEQFTEEHLARRIRLAADMTQESAGLNITPTEKLRQIQNLWWTLEAPAAEESMSEAVTKKLEQWQEDSPEGTLDWPLTCMNDQLVSIEDDLVFLCARQSVGKTALALQMMVHWARAGIKSSMASLESDKTRIGLRLTAQLSGVNMVRVRKRQATEQEIKKAKAAGKGIDALPLRVIYKGMNMEQLYAWGQLEKARGSRILIIDNMKHIRPSRKYTNTVEQFRDISQRLKWMRDDLKLPLIVLHHLNKDMDVSWSDDINRDADIILILELLEAQSVAAGVGNPGYDMVSIHVDKNRDGPAHIEFNAKFLKHIQTWENVETPKAKGWEP